MSEKKDNIQHNVEQMEVTSVFPMGEISGFPVRPGFYNNNGATVFEIGVNFTVHTRDGESCELLLFHSGEEEPFAVLPFPEEYKVGDVYAMIVFGLDINNVEYAYRISGPYEPEKGLIYDKNAILLDPYARAVANQQQWGVKQTGRYHARIIADTYDWGAKKQSKCDMSDLIIYELHVRGFTRDPSSGVKNPGTFDGIREKIPYLKELGINAVELMPIFEFDETLDSREVDGKNLLNYWGYNPVCFFAPNASYSTAADDHGVSWELKNLIRELHDNGIEVILDVVFNHTAEGNEKGPMFSFKGFDNRIYYMLTADGYYYNFSGCGNTLNCNNPIVQQMILECLRHWTINYRVDGFRFDLASILGRNEDGSPMNNPPLLKSLAYDPVLSKVKLIAEAWDAGGMYQVGSFPASHRWAEWNGRYRDSVRGFLKGDSENSWTAAWSIAGSGDLYGGLYDDFKEEYAGYDSCVNFLTCHDGFTLYDLYAYNEKHNEANGWDNTDGANDNRSWNCGTEGETDDPKVNALRFQMIRNACAVLMCSRGTPMFFAGDEFGNTQYGNNNSYCQDNEISWLDWSLLEKNHSLFEFFKFMIHYRFRHRVIRKRLPDSVCGMPPLSAHDVNAEITDLPENAKTFGICFAGYDRKRGCDDIVYVAVNSYWEDVEITLPEIPHGGTWYLSVNTTGDEKGRYYYEECEERRIVGSFVMRARSTAVFSGRTH